MALPNNPSTFTITDPKFGAEFVTGFNVKFGRVSKTYTLSAPVPSADINAASGSASGTIAELNQVLAPGTWFAAATAVNASGESAVSPEASFTITAPVPSAPSAFTVA